jgi:hypothetical protein
MPAFIAPWLGFVLGIAFAWAAADEIAADPTSVLGSRALVVAVLFGVLVFAPASGYFVAFDGDWSFAYLVNTQKMPSAVVLALVLVDASAVPAGFMFAAPHARRRRMGPVLTLAAVPAAVALLCMLIFSRRLGVAATYSQFHGDFGTRSVAGTPLGYALVWMDGVLAIAVALTVRGLRRMSAAVRRRSPSRL